MAIDTAFKRRSSAASRRMPWMRRFGIAPDGTIAQRDRQAGPWVYAGIGAVGAEPDPHAGWIAANRPALFEATPRTPLMIAAARKPLWIAKVPR